MLREIREDTAGITKELAAVREENGELKKKIVAMRKRGHAELGESTERKQQERKRRR
jgi:translation elongation factor EF-Ts